MDSECQYRYCQTRNLPTKTVVTNVDTKNKRLIKRELKSNRKPLGDSDPVLVCQMKIDRQGGERT